MLLLMLVHFSSIVLSVHLYRNVLHGISLSAALRNWSQRLSCLIRKYHCYVVLGRASSLLDRQFRQPYYNQGDYLDLHLVVPNPQFVDLGD